MGECVSLAKRTCRVSTKGDRCEEGAGEVTRYVGCENMGEDNEAEGQVYMHEQV